MFLAASGLAALSLCVACGGTAATTSGTGSTASTAAPGAAAKGGATEVAGTWVHADGNTLTVAGSSFSHKTVYQGGAYREESGRITSFDAANKRFTVEYDKAVEDGKKADLTPGTRFVIYEVYGERVRFYIKRDAYAPLSELKEVWYVRQGATP